MSTRIALLFGAAVSALALLGASCHRREASDGGSTGSGATSAVPAGDRMTGTLRLGATDLALTACHAGQGETTYVEVTTAAGRLRFEAKQLFWQPDAATKARGEALACGDIRRSWGGGQRDDGSSFFRGTLRFRCEVPGGAPLIGDLTLDCGGVTANERKLLDENGAKARAGASQ